MKKNFASTKLLDYALAVETVTTSKKDNLILNVDGCIAVCFVDLMRSCGAFSAEEAEDYLKMGVLNGLFVLGRSIGLIAHFLDQKRLRTGLYRHPWYGPYRRPFESDVKANGEPLGMILPTCYRLSTPAAARDVWKSPCEWHRGRGRTRNKFFFGTLSVLVAFW